MSVFSPMPSDTYINLTLGTAAVTLLASEGKARNAGDAGAFPVHYATHVKIQSLHSGYEMVGALVADTGTCALTTGNCSAVVAGFGNSVIIPLTRARRVSIVASAANTAMSAQFGTIKI